MKYPNGITKEFHHLKSYSNRGQNLENEINEANEYYRVNDIAIIYKKPVPITIVKVDYPSRKDAVIKEAYFRTPSTTDYNGIYKGQYIDFEAKETTNNNFPLANIHEHQIKHLDSIIKHGGIGFLIVRFTKLSKTFYLDANKLIEFISNNTSKSIPLSFFEENGYIIKQGIILDYLKIIEGEYNEKKN